MVWAARAVALCAASLLGLVSCFVPVHHAAPRKILAMGVAEAAETGAWVPIASASALEKIQPVQIEVLGEKLVVWEALSEKVNFDVLQDADVEMTVEV